VRSHDLNRLLDEPGLMHGATMLFLLEIYFPATPSAKGIGGFQSDGGDDLRPSLQWRAARTKHLGQQSSRFVLFFCPIAAAALVGH